METAMTKKYWLRSSIFNILFYFVTATCCVLLLPTLIAPRGVFLFVVRFWLFWVDILERFVLGLRYEIRGLEHLPTSGSYILAAKHESAYETMKLHPLFGDPAIILKQELLKVPLWGAYLKKSDQIAIDRSNAESAITSIQDGARRMKDQGRPIVIFPQGTRVWSHAPPNEKPYKVGVARIQEATDLPIIPMALNSGYFWPRQGWCKRPGTVVFEFLPAIASGKPRDALLKTLEVAIEGKSNDLTQEAILEEKHSKRSGLSTLLLLLLVILGCAYSAWWFWMADQVRSQHDLFLKTDKQMEQFQDRAVYREYSGASVGGFPGPMKLRAAKEHIRFPTATVDIENFEAKSWPFPNMPVEIETGPLSVQDLTMPTPLSFDSFTGKFTPSGRDVIIEYAQFQKAELIINITGEVRELTAHVPDIDLIITAQNYTPLVQRFVSEGLIDAQSANFILAGLRALEKDGVLTVPLTTNNGFLYAGPFMIMNLNQLPQRLKRLP